MSEEIDEEMFNWETGLTMPQEEDFETQEEFEEAEEEYYSMERDIYDEWRKEIPQAMFCDAARDIIVEAQKAGEIPDYGTLEALTEKEIPDVTDKS